MPTINNKIINFIIYYRYFQHAIDLSKRTAEENKICDLVSEIVQGIEIVDIDR